MKKLLFLLVFATICAFGQQKVYQRDVFSDKVLSELKSESLYPTLNLIKVDDKRVDSKFPELESRKIIYEFTKFAIKKNIKFSELDWNKYVPIELLFNQNGSLDYLVYGFQQIFVDENNSKIRRSFKFDTLNVEQTKIFVDLAEDFCKNYILKQTKLGKNFSINTSLSFGRDQRKPKKNTISTIEMAQNCDKPDTVKSLMFNKLYLELFPEVVFRFKNLEKLDLSDNLIETVPKRLSELKKLKFLSLSGNYINYEEFKFKRNKHLKDLNLQYTGMTKIQRSMKRNRSLEILFLGNNPIVFTKNDFRKLTGLKALNLYNVKTATLPKSIAKLQKLEELDLYYNELQFLPKEICQLKNLKTLAVANNQLWNLPEEISKMPNLQTLYAHHNRLNSLPTLPNLKLLDVGYNVFKVFPEQVYSLKNLEEFDITNNKIEEIPAKLLSMQKLQKVYIRGNEFFQIDEKSKEITKLVADLEQKQILVR